MTEQFTPVTLQGTYCTLVPLSHEHLTDLCEAAKDGKLSQLWYTFVPEPSKMAENISLRLKMQEEGTMLPFTVIDNHSDKAVGMTTYLNIDKPNCRVEIEVLGIVKVCNALD